MAAGGSAPLLAPRASGGGAGAGSWTGRSAWRRGGPPGGKGAPWCAPYSRKRSLFPFSPRWGRRGVPLTPRVPPWTLPGRSDGRLSEHTPGGGAVPSQEGAGHLGPGATGRGQRPHSADLLTESGVGGGKVRWGPVAVGWAAGPGQWGGRCRSGPGPLPACWPGGRVRGARRTLHLPAAHRAVRHRAPGEGLQGWSV